MAQAYAEHLATSGVERGLIGPRETERLWERHILNCALLARAVPDGTRTVADVGSGAGLPGMVLAIARPDLSVTLIETMLRRTTWLEEVASEIGLEIEIVRSRAEELHGQRVFDAVTARAVAALDKLARWCLPLVSDGGSLLALKGLSAAEEIEKARKVLKKLGGSESQILTIGEGELPIPTRVVRVSVSRAAKG
ncbi:16S rRNA (guanine(527)-N(7))-methyltransferase RsmG [Dermabacteraceae bacterium TAE3-ERU27]|nr:16S rRNA (guanine(527)-N(7))-methyltransferase RsmG [Dermabacteraceae bacterium TAE3-ERU27]